MSESVSDRVAFVRANAVALVNDLEAQVARQRHELNRLNHTVAALRQERDRLRETLRGVHAMAEEDLRRDFVAPFGSVHQIEADAHAALARSGIVVGEG